MECLFVRVRVMDELSGRLGSYDRLDRRPQGIGESFCFNARDKEAPALLTHIEFQLRVQCIGERMQRKHARRARESRVPVCRTYAAVHLYVQQLKVVLICEPEVGEFSSVEPDAAAVLTDVELDPVDFSAKQTASALRTFHRSAYLYV